MSHFTRISLGLFRIHKSDAPSYGACIIGDPGATVELREKRVLRKFAPQDSPVKGDRENGEAVLPLD
jgi:hypothetical protein